jgi:hypothetical protein
VLFLLDPLHKSVWEFVCIAVCMGALQGRAYIIPLQHVQRAHCVRAEMQAEAFRRPGSRCLQKANLKGRIMCNWQRVNKRTWIDGGKYNEHYMVGKVVLHTQLSMSCDAAHSG